MPVALGPAFSRRLVAPSFRFWTRVSLRNQLPNKRVRVYIYMLLCIAKKTTNKSHGHRKFGETKRKPIMLAVLFLTIWLWQVQHVATRTSSGLAYKANRTTETIFGVLLFRNMFLGGCHETQDQPPGLPVCNTVHISLCSKVVRVNGILMLKCVCLQMFPPPPNNRGLRFEPLQTNPQKQAVHRFERIGHLPACWKQELAVCGTPTSS